VATHQIKLRLPSELGIEKVAIASAATIAARMGFPPSRIEDIKTLVAEACINAIEHGNALDRAVPLDVELDEGPDHLDITITDAGRKRIPRPLPNPGDSAHHRGWGLYMMQTLADEFDCGLTPQGGNCIHLRLKLLPSPA
jgi:serine/threonine-protein kinase RsbW